MQKRGERQSRTFALAPRVLKRFNAICSRRESTPIGSSCGRWEIPACGCKRGTTGSTGGQKSFLAISGPSSPNGPRYRSRKAGKTAGPQRFESVKRHHPSTRTLSAERPEGRKRGCVVWVRLGALWSIAVARLGSMGRYMSTRSNFDFRTRPAKCSHTLGQNCIFIDRIPRSQLSRYSWHDAFRLWL